MAVTQVARWRDGLLVYIKAYVKAYASREDALRDLGVSEDELEPIRPVMASANLDLVRSIYVAWERGDFGRADWADPEIELMSADGSDPGSWKGMAEVDEKWRQVALAPVEVDAR